jgi:hypothetical protein
MLTTNPTGIRHSERGCRSQSGRVFGSDDNMPIGSCQPEFCAVSALIVPVKVAGPNVMSIKATKSATRSKDLRLKMIAAIRKFSPAKRTSSPRLYKALALATWLTGGVPEAAASTPAPARIKSTSTIAVYSALNETTNSQFLAAFRAATPGMEVKALPLAAEGDLQARIRNEKSSPQADIFVGGSSEFHAGLAKEGLLEV